ncbi:MAG: patatin-like phospholipase family protein [Mesorhizobium sp.]|uniref:patatin-like phospholipase family protein n=1 Tax=Mesorhizobium sp. TaxID=1871066 RepID=UPI0011FC5937|nr:patatin-like phospholipase family protein [Mesorhizobium sp.]TIO76596.1 MAG: patatin-like phospholipase family protein [Mesorhizobium sp.]TIO81243.1 MAG: patatin-like phospholipase family protein [Mesorhizobium sp.]
MLERTRNKAVAATIQEISAQYDRIALVFQGGGALGAYQAGVYQALSDAGCEPTWLSGVSIGAINASIIAGNEPSRRLQRLEQFWQTISGRKIWAYTPEGDIYRDIRNRTSSWMTMMMGQPGFFKPRNPNPWLELSGAEGATSFYDTAELKDTLERLIDFDVLNDGRKRLSVGAVNVRTGNFVYFDTEKVRIGPEHIMASGALPPAFPSVRIEGEYYWDGGIVSNTPLQYLLDQEEDRSSLVFQVDLFSARGALPRGMADVLSRHKDIMYSSRTRQNTDNFQRIHALKMKLLDALKRVPPDELRDGERELIADYSDAGVVNIVHLIYQHKGYEGHAKDYEFSGTSMREHWEMGLEDTERTLRHKQWLMLPTNVEGVAIHDLHREDPT